MLRVANVKKCSCLGILVGLMVRALVMQHVGYCSCKRNMQLNMKVDYGIYTCQIQASDHHDQPSGE